MWDSVGALPSAFEKPFPHDFVFKLLQIVSEFVQSWKGFAVEYVLAAVSPQQPEDGPWQALGWNVVALPRIIYVDMGCDTRVHCHLLPIYHTRPTHQELKPITILT